MDQSLEAFELDPHAKARGVLLFVLQEFANHAQKALYEVSEFGDQSDRIKDAIYAMGSVARSEVSNEFIYDRLLNLQILVNGTKLQSLVEKIFNAFKEITLAKGDKGSSKAQINEQLAALIAEAGQALSRLSERAGNADSDPQRTAAEFSRIALTSLQKVEENAAKDSKEINAFNINRQAVRSALLELPHRSNYYHKMATRNPAKRAAIRFLDRLVNLYQVNHLDKKELKAFSKLLREAVRLVCITSEENSDVRATFRQIWESINNSNAFEQAERQEERGQLKAHDVKSLESLQEYVANLSLRVRVLYMLVDYDAHLEKKHGLDSTSACNYRALGGDNIEKRLAIRDLWYATVSGASDEDILSAMGRFVYASALGKKVVFDGKKGSQGEQRFAAFYLEQCATLINEAFTVGGREKAARTTDGNLVCDFEQLSDDDDVCSYGDKSWVLRTVCHAVMMNHKSLFGKRNLLDGDTKKNLALARLTYATAGDDKKVKAALLELTAAIETGADFNTVKTLISTTITAAQKDTRGSKAYRSIIDALTEIQDSLKNTIYDVNVEGRENFNSIYQFVLRAFDAAQKQASRKSRANTGERGRSSTVRETSRQVKTKVHRATGTDLTDECCTGLIGLRLIAQHGSAEQVFLQLGRVMYQFGEELQDKYENFYHALNNVYNEAAESCGVVKPLEIKRPAFVTPPRGKTSGDDRGLNVGDMTPPPSLKTNFDDNPIGKGLGEALLQVTTGGKPGDGLPPPPPPRDDEEEFSESEEEGVGHAKSQTNLGGGSLN